MTTRTLMVGVGVLALWTGCESGKGSGGSGVDASPDAAVDTRMVDAAADLASDVRDGGAEAGAEVGLGLFGVWREVQEIARTSPDHLTAAADRAVASKDAQAILTFVANSITTIPARGDGFGDAGTARRFGTRTVLRGGSGT